MVLNLKLWKCSPVMEALYFQAIADTYFAKIKSIYCFRSPASWIRLASKLTIFHWPLVFRT